MANNITAAKPTLYQRFVNRLGASVNEYTKVCEALTWDTPTLQTSDLFGLTGYAAQVATPTAQDIKASGVTTNSATFEKLVKITETSAIDTPGITNDIVDALADAGAHSIAKACFDALEALPVTAHPDSVAGYVANGGGTAFFCDDFSDPVNQSGVTTNALSASSLTTARQILRQYKTKSGVNAHLDVSNENLCLVVPPILETTAKDLVSRGGEIYDGSGLQSGSFGGMTVAINAHTGDDTDWVLTLKGKSCPLAMWIRKPPTLRVTQMPDTGHWAFYAMASYSAVLRNWEGGLVYNSG